MLKRRRADADHAAALRRFSLSLDAELEQSQLRRASLGADTLPPQPPAGRAYST